MSIDHVMANLSPGDRQRVQRIWRLLDNERLFEYLFSDDSLLKQSLRAPPATLAQNTYSTGEQIMLRVALNIWDDGCVSLELNELLRLDRPNLERVVENYLNVPVHCIY